MTIRFPVLMTVLASIAISAFGASSSLEIVRILQAYFERDGIRTIAATDPLTGLAQEPGALAR